MKYPQIAPTNSPTPIPSVNRKVAFFCDTKYPTTLVPMISKPQVSMAQRLLSIINVDRRHVRHDDAIPFAVEEQRIVLERLGRRRTRRPHRVLKHRPQLIPNFVSQTPHRQAKRHVLEVSRRIAHVEPANLAEQLPPHRQGRASRPAHPLGHVDTPVRCVPPQPAMEWSAPGIEQPAATLDRV